MDFALQELTLQFRRWSGGKCCDEIYGHRGGAPGPRQSACSGDPRSQLSPPENLGAVYKK